MNRINSFLKKINSLKREISFVIFCCLYYFFRNSEYTTGYDDPNLFSKLLLLIELLLVLSFFFWDNFEFFKKELNRQWVLQILILMCIPLFVIGTYQMDYNFYLFLRYYICFTSILFLYNQRKNGQPISKIFLGIILLFNPIIPFQFEKEWWLMVDAIIGGVFLFHLAFFDLYTTSEKIEKKHDTTSEKQIDSNLDKLIPQDEESSRQDSFIQLEKSEKVPIDKVKKMQAKSLVEKRSLKDSPKKNTKDLSKVVKYLSSLPQSQQQALEQAQEQQRHNEQAYLNYTPEKVPFG